MSKAMQIASEFVVLDGSLRAESVTVSETLYQELDEKYAGFTGCTLIASHAFEEDWPTWEVHPHGDEFVVLLSGSVEMVLAMNGDDEVIDLSEPGSFVIVPRGVWHTARVREPSQMLFVTPGEGTENREQPPR